LFGADRADSLPAAGTAEIFSKHADKLSALLSTGRGSSSSVGICR